MNLVLELVLLVGIIIYSYLESLVKFFIPRRRKSVAGQTVLITGAGHGIGRLTAYEFAKRKSRLVLWDINKHGVEETAAKCRKLGAIVHVFVVDCSNRTEIYGSVDQVKKEVGDIEIVVNNAGAIYPADLLSAKDEEITRTFEVNILGHFWNHKSTPSIDAEKKLWPHCHSGFSVRPWGDSVSHPLLVVACIRARRSCEESDGWDTYQQENDLRSILYQHFSDNGKGFLPERALKAIRRIQNIQFEAIVGHKTKMK
ncbi:17-beta-hydroxysteroid dehydrogenase 13 [Apodemus speciosus]|uniref:17-beta-hydroxysteroid dehydrogenase 13 n=1 Tax=Apodemus speciosus TaxID=105296 RepID=A0ABQ0ES84_APOSI